MRNQPEIADLRRFKPDNKTAMPEGMKHLAKDCPAEVAVGTGVSWGSAK